jgi:hypothetical protein
MAKARPETIIHQCPFKLTDTEVAERGKQLAQLGYQLSANKESAKEAAASFKKKAQEIESQQSALARVVSEGQEYRPMPCHWIYVEREAKAFLLRDDTGETVADRPLTSAELAALRQGELPLGDEELRTGGAN